MTEGEESSIMKIRLPEDNLRTVEALCALEHIDHSTLIKQLIEDGLLDRIIRLYGKGKLTAAEAQKF